MKNTSYFSLIVLASILLGFNSCRDKVKETFMGNVPIYMSYEDLRQPVQFTSSQVLEKPGKIYIYGNYLFINEWYKGVHIFDNSNPASPVNVGFIAIPGNLDIAVKGNTLLASSFTDLVVVDISDVNHPKELIRKEDMFSYFYSPTANFNPVLPVGEVDEEEGVVIDWKQEEISVYCDVDCHDNMVFTDGIRTFGDMAVSSESSMPAPSTNSGEGKGGSMARFAIARDHLYVVSATDLHVLDISNPAEPLTVSNVDLGLDIETIFPHEDKLFIGSETSVYIYDISSPAHPSQISVFSHVRACDPVVVQGDYAYATLRAGGPCGGWQSQLLVIDISDITVPRLLREYSMREPYGLGIDGDALFVCEGKNGLRIFDSNDPHRITQNELGHNEVHAFDVIPINNVLILTGNNGIFQYDYTDPEDLRLLSSIHLN